MTVAEILSFAIALWLGMYLVARDPTDSRLRWTGISLFAYALALSGQIVAMSGPPPPISTILRTLYPFFLTLPALFWTRALLEFLPETLTWLGGMRRYWAWLHWPLALLLGASTWATARETGNVLSSPVYPGFVGLVLLPLILVFGLAAWQMWQRRHSKLAGSLLVLILLFGLGIALPITAWGWRGHRWWQVGIGLDLILLGSAIAALDAFDQGEAFRPDFVRSLDAACFALLLFAGPVALTIGLATGLTTAMACLLLVMIISAIATQIFSAPLQTFLDQLAFPTQTQLQQQRADLRTTAETLPKVNPAFDLAALAKPEFVRLTRRALTHFNDLPRLAASPLTRLPVIEARLAGRPTGDNSLERARELQCLLREAILRLKPASPSDFDPGEGWRYYNALYFPYVVGLKPYSRRADHSHLDPASQQALTWLRTHVPERTLHNWQNAAAQLVADYLRTTK